MPQALVFDQTCPSTGSLLHIHISTCFSTHIEPAVLLHKRIIAPEPFNTYIQHMCLRNTVLCQAAMLLHQKVFTPTSFYTSKFYTSKLLHRHFFHKPCCFTNSVFTQPLVFFKQTFVQPANGRQAEGGQTAEGC
jgi:hypothetical protein